MRKCPDCGWKVVRRWVRLGDFLWYPVEWCKRCQYTVRVYSNGGPSRQKPAPREQIARGLIRDDCRSRIEMM